MANLDKAANDKKIVRLANQLLNALADSGYNTDTSVGDANHVGIWVIETGIVEVENIINNWKVRGKLRKRRNDG